MDQQTNCALFLVWHMKHARWQILKHQTWRARMIKYTLKDGVLISFGVILFRNISNLKIFFTVSWTQTSPRQPSFRKNSLNRILQMSLTVWECCSGPHILPFLLNPKKLMLANWPTLLDPSYNFHYLGTGKKLYNLTTQSSCRNGAISMKWLLLILRTNFVAV